MYNFIWIQKWRSKDELNFIEMNRSHPWNKRGVARSMSEEIRIHIPSFLRAFLSMVHTWAKQQHVTE
ncbi:unnamed protein product [Larinioides sclopetarius]|uniref:Uncharacterized protein n=1 Tax=Larinioides sclopetarius TaxID=280406 RepID=A0AAV1YTH3_9ARAC